MAAEAYGQWEAMTDMNGSFWLIIGCVVHNLHRTTLTPLYHFEIYYTKTPQLIV